MKNTAALSLVGLLLWAGGAPAVVDKPPAQAGADQYVTNQIVIKFHEAAADAIQEQLALEESARGLTLSANLDGLNARYRVKQIKPVFKDFKKHRQKLKALLKEDKSLLTKKQKHILRRLRRAPKGAPVPGLDRIYKIQLDLEPGQSLKEAVAAYENDPDVEYAELNYIVSIDRTPNDPLYPIQWPLHNIGQMYPESGSYNYPPGTPDCDIDAPEAWDTETGSSEVIVAVVDTGVDYTHRDLQGNMWTDPTGYYGYDFVNDDNDPIDDHGHGTYCAGIIAADSNNGIDIAGVCWNAKIMALKFIDSRGYGEFVDAFEAFYYAVDSGADVISNSWGMNYYSETMEQAVEYAYSQGVIVVASAGNDNSSLLQYPASYDHVIAVAATNSNDQKAPFSNYGNWVDIAAPGVDVLSLRASGTSMGTTYDDYATVASGTSMACPQVSGACGLLLAHNYTLTIDDVNDILRTQADTISSGICDSNGRLNLHKAITVSQGRLNLDKDYYSCFDEIIIELIDFDMKGQAGVNVTLITSEGDSETVTLNETSPTWVFAGTILTDSSIPMTENGILEVAHGQNITVTYQDSNDGTGNPVTATDTAQIDCQRPVVINVEIDVLGSPPIVTFETDEPTRTRLLCGLDCSDTNEIIVTNSSYTTNHVIRLIGASPETEYFFVIEAIDAAGNVTLTDNDGICYSFILPVFHDLYVPSRYPSFQTAINDANNGDIVWVADGIYYGEGNHDIDFLGKAITVRSENGPNNCIVDCQNAGRGFCFHNDENADSVLAGFTITSGYAGQGGGIYCDSNATVTNCVLANNWAGYSVAAGGGVYTGEDRSPIITDCLFIGNWGTEGGGLANYYSDATIINCTFERNSAAIGGGMKNCGGRETITSCIFKSNSAVFMGGGMQNASLSRVTVANCTFVGNSAGSYGGGMCSPAGNKPTVTNCLFYGNSAVKWGGGMYNAGTRHPIVINCTFSENSASEGGGIRNRGSSTPSLTNCILWANSDSNGTDESAQIYGDDPPVINYSCIKGWTSTLGGVSNTGADPCFADADNGDCRLKSEAGRWRPNSESWVQDEVTSPCIDRGDPTSPVGNEPLPNGGRINMGAYGGTSHASKSLTCWHASACAGQPYGDANCDGVGSLTDLLALKTHFGQNAPWTPSECCADFNHDDSVNFADLFILKANYGSGPYSPSTANQNCPP